MSPAIGLTVQRPRSSQLHRRRSRSVDDRNGRVTSARCGIAIGADPPASTLNHVSLNYDAAIVFISSIPEGCWTTYGDVADAAGNRDAALRIGEWLMESGGSIPFYWRVIYSSGEVPAGFIASTAGLPRNALEARERLLDEGVTFDGERAGEQCRYTVEQWREAGRPSGAGAAQAYVLADVERYVEHKMTALPSRLEDLHAVAGSETVAVDSIAISRAIISLSPRDIPAHNRLGRAYQNLGLLERARAAFEVVVQLDPGNPIATNRLQELRHTERSRGHQG
jgi:alkylated DNA nucleotide flippase Atl1